MIKFCIMHDKNAMKTNVLSPKAFIPFIFNNPSPKKIKETKILKNDF